MATATAVKPNDPVKAKAHFEDKMAFTTGPVELNRLIEQKQDIVLIDVRAEEDFREGHIPGAVNLPQERWDSLQGLSKDKQNVVYCYSLVCHLAAKAAIKFAGAGFPVMELDGGMRSWREHDLPVQR